MQAEKKSLIEPGKQERTRARNKQSRTWGSVSMTFIVSFFRLLELTELRLSFSPSDDREPAIFYFFFFFFKSASSLLQTERVNYSDGWSLCLEKNQFYTESKG